MTVTIEPGYRIQLPAEWLQALGIDRVAQLERIGQGILVRAEAATKASWDTVFANKLPVGRKHGQPGEVEVKDDDLLYRAEPTLTRGLDTMLIVYSLLEGHPASVPCEQFLRAHQGWFTTVSVIFETKAVLVKVYGVEPSLASGKIESLASGPLTILGIEPATALTSLRLADAHDLDITDSALLATVRQIGAKNLATEDQKLGTVCSTFGIAHETPFDAHLRQQVAAWESAHIPEKGLPRVLRRVHEWLRTAHTEAAQDLWSATGNGSHLP